MSGVAVRERTQESGPLERLEALFDPGSLALVRTGVRSDAIGDRAEPGDGVLAGAGRVGGRTVFAYSQDARFLGGSLGEAHADSIVRVLELAERSGSPVVGFVESGGARLQEGHAALGGYGRIFRRTVELSGRVPQISVIAGVSARSVERMNPEVLAAILPRIYPQMLNEVNAHQDAGRKSVVACRMQR